MSVELEPGQIWEDTMLGVVFEIVRPIDGLRGRFWAKASGNLVSEKTVVGRAALSREGCKLLRDSERVES